MVASDGTLGCFSLWMSTNQVKNALENSLECFPAFPQLLDTARWVLSPCPGFLPLKYTSVHHRGSFWGYLHTAYCFSQPKQIPNPGQLHTLDTRTSFPCCLPTSPAVGCCCQDFRQTLTYFSYIAAIGEVEIQCDLSVIVTIYFYYDIDVKHPWHISHSRTSCTFILP